MSDSYFKVSEEVILCSINHPELSGNAVVLEVFPDKKSRLAYYARNYPLDIMRMKDTNEPHYQLTIQNPLNEHGMRGLWLQSSLRKKHKPYNDDEFNFSDEDIPYPMEEIV